MVVVVARNDDDDRNSSNDNNDGWRHFGGDPFFNDKIDENRKHRLRGPRASKLQQR